MNSQPVYYLGGSPCAGKSSVAALIAGRYGLRHVKLDDRLFAHLAAAAPASQPNLASIAAASCDELWLIPPREQVRRTVRAYVEEFPLHLIDLETQTEALLLEGAALLPCLVASQQAPPSHVLYMVPTSDFQRMHYERRPWIQDVLKGCSDPFQAFENWMDRDVHFARWVRQQALHYGFNTIKVDGSQSVAANAERAALLLRLDSRAGC